MNIAAAQRVTTLVTESIYDYVWMPTCAFCFQRGMEGVAGRHTHHNCDLMVKWNKERRQLGFTEVAVSDSAIARTDVRPAEDLNAALANVREQAASQAAELVGLRKVVKGLSAKVEAINQLLPTSQLQSGKAKPDSSGAKVTANGSAKSKGTKKKSKKGGAEDS